MARSMIVCSLLAIFSFDVRGQEQPKPTETLIKLQLSPMAVPRAALKYMLLPDLKETNPGNPVQGYLKCFMEQNHFFFEKTADAKREKWLVMPLAELPVAELRGYGGNALRQADDAARLETPDWQILMTLKRDGVRTLLPDVQWMRRIGAALKVRFRGEVADGRYDDAVRTAKTMFALARHLGEHPTFIGDLVGIAVAHIAFGPLEEMIGQPGSPNLYWALTNLPDPLVDIRKGSLGERLWVLEKLALLSETTPMSESDLQKTVATFTEVTSDPAKDAAARQAFEQKAKDEGVVATARKRLVEFGMKEERVKSFPPLQVLLLDDKREYEERNDELMKEIALPFWQIDKRLDKNPQSPDSLMVGFISAGIKVRGAQARMQQRIALLRHVEAIRMYLAETGKLPSALTDLKTPLPVDPFSGTAFQYKLEGGVAHLWGAPPLGAEKSPIVKVRYELTVRK